MFLRREECVGACPYIHGCVDLCYGLIIQGKLVDLDAVADQLAHDFDLELVQFALTDGVCFGNHWDDVDLKLEETRSKQASMRMFHVSSVNFTTSLIM